MDRPRAIFLQKRIHDWSLTLPPWQRALLRELSQGPLSDDARDRLLAFLLGELDAVTPPPLRLSDLPADETEHGVVELREIRDLRNINRLAGEQTLRLGPGLNIVFGENGTGKSGYGRLCRRVCRAAEPGEVLRDVFDPGASDEPQTAQIVLSVDGDRKVVEVDLAGDPPRLLSAMTAFDASCARVYLSKANSIDHTPRSLRLLKEMAAAQDQMTQALSARIAEREAALPELPAVPEGTVAADLIRRIAEGEASADDVRAVAERAGEERAELDALERAEATIRADRSEALAAAAQAKAASVQELIDTIERAWSHLDDDALAQLEHLRSTSAAASAAAEQLARDAFADQRMPGTGGVEWRLMWDAARRFVESSGEPFPVPSVCPVCQQDLDGEARARMERFEAFVAGDLQRQADEAEEAVAQRIAALPGVEALERTARAALAGEAGEFLESALKACAALSARRRIALAEPHPPLPEALDLSAVRAHVAAKTAEAERHARLRDEDEQHRVRKRLVPFSALVVVYRGAVAMAAVCRAVGGCAAGWPSAGPA